MSVIINPSSNIVISGSITISNGAVTISNIVAGSVTISNGSVTVSNILAGSVTISNCSVTISNIVAGAVTVSNIATSVSISNGSVTISNIQSGSVTISNGSISVNNLVSVLSTVTNAGTFAVQVTSLPSFAGGQVISVRGLTSAAVTNSNGTITVSNLGSVSVSINNIVIQPNNWSFTATYTGAVTSSIVRANPGSTSALYITDIIASNENTAGNIKFVQTDAALAVVI